MGNGKLSLYTRKSQLIYRYIRQNESVSKQDIVVGLKLSLPTVTQNLQHLHALGLVDTSMKIQNTGGRSATAYTYVDDARMAIGVNLTAHHITAVSVDLSGNMMEMEKKAAAFDLDSDTYLRKIGELVELVKQKTGIDDSSLLGVGVSVQGLVANDGEEVICGMTLNFTGRTRAQIAKYIAYKNRLFHDFEAAGYAEVWIDQELNDAFYINLGNSVGGAVIWGNEIYMGDSYKGGEIGHMVLDPNNKQQCYCGKYGCFDTMCRATNLSDYTGGDLDVFFSLLGNDAHAQALWQEYLQCLSLAIHNLRMLFNSSIILGGYVGSYFGEYMEQLCTMVDERNPFHEKASEYLRPCKYQVEAAAAGAAIRFINDFFESI